ncbi:hypothetical protein ACWGQ5_22500 [Streptomyces sp. NPDC055722]
MTEEEVKALPARFHVPVFLDTCTPKAWVCAVCWGDGWNTQGPCKAAQDHGTRVFTPEHDAETAAKRQAAEIEALRARVAELERRYVGQEPTVAEEMAYLSSCLDAVHEVCDAAEKQATRWEQPLPVPDWVATVRAAASGEQQPTAVRPALGWAFVLGPAERRQLLSELAPRSEYCRGSASADAAPARPSGPWSLARERTCRH